MRNKTIIKQIIHRNFYGLLKNHQYNSRHSKTFWVLQIIDLRQGKHSFNHCTEVEPREQGATSYTSYSLHFTFHSLILEEKVENLMLRRAPQTMILPHIMIYPPAWTPLATVVTKGTFKINPTFSKWGIRMGSFKGLSCVIFKMCPIFHILNQRRK